MNLAYVEHKDFLKHEMGTRHPESPSRITAIEDALNHTGMFNRISRYQAPLANDQDILRAHTQKHLDFLTAKAPKSGYLHLDIETAMNPHTLTAARRAVGASLFALELLVRKVHKKAFCAVRPPGHHAERERAMGFCFFNNIAIAAKTAVQVHGISKIAVVDFDVHHGNGTESILACDPSILLCSSFQSPFYPHSNFRRDDPRIVNVELAPGSGSKEFRQAVTEKWIPKIEEFKPELFLVSAGFDAAKGDPLADLELSPKDFRWIGKKLSVLSERYAQGRVISSLEGGYNTATLGKSVAEFLKGL